MKGSFTPKYEGNSFRKLSYIRGGLLIIRVAFGQRFHYFRSPTLGCVSVGVLFLWAFHSFFPPQAEVCSHVDMLSFWKSLTFVIFFIQMS